MKRFSTGKQSAPHEFKRMTLALGNALDADAEEGTFSGYASLFGRVDLGKDRVAKGAFARSLAKRGTSGIRMLFQHDPAHPIGRWNKILEDERGLFVQGTLSQHAAKGREALGLMREKALDGLSIGFRTIRSTTDRKTGIRTILEADLWEISIVTFPMLPQARVSQVKSAGASERHLPTIRTFERWLTRDAGLTRREARIVIAKGFTHLIGKRDLAASQANREDAVQHIQAATQALIRSSNSNSPR